MNGNNRISPKELQKSLILVILGISFGITFFNIIGNPVGGPPFTGFMRALGASNLVYGVVMALPVLGAIVQIFASFYIEKTGRRKSVFLIFGFIHRFLWIPIALIPLFFRFENKYIIIIIITVLVTISSASNSTASICFLSWMGDLIPMEVRGKFFSTRTAVFTSVGAVTSILVGRYLDTINGLNGYAVIFIIAAILGAADIFCFIWVKNPKMEISEDRMPFKKLLTIPFKDKNYLKFILFAAIWYFGTNIALPFLNIYMLEYLNLSYFLIFLFIQVINNISTVLLILFLGKVVDLYGNKPVQAICCTMLAILQFMWIFAAPENFVIVPVIYFLNGICLAGFELTTTNLSIWLPPEKNRSIYVANYTLVISVIGIAMAYISGGAYLELTKDFFTNLNLSFVNGQKFSNFHSLFIISTIIRLTAIFLVHPKVSEENSKSPWDLIKSLKFLFLRRQNT
ncbi:MAG: MFS transporter [Clostridiaceae bacterium]|nr:MFS transporter [Clostridiaceae bacterium]